MFKSQRDPTARYHFLESYLNRDQVEQVLNHYSDYIVAALYIYHDKDVKEVDNQSGKRLEDLHALLRDTQRQIEVLKQCIAASSILYGERNFTTDEERRSFQRANITIPKQRLTKLAKKIVNIQGEISQIEADQKDVGNLKEAHWHILLKTYDDHSANAVRKWFYRFRITETKEINGVTQDVLVNTLNRLADSPGACRDYLTHRNNPEKYQYSEKDVIEYRNGWEIFNHASRCNDDVILIMDRMLQGESYRQLCREYGKDFLYHLKAFEYCANKIRSQEDHSYNYVGFVDEALNSNNKKLQDRIDWSAANDAAQVINVFQTFMREVNTLYTEAQKKQENGVH